MRAGVTVIMSSLCQAIPFLLLFLFHYYSFLTAIPPSLPPSCSHRHFVLIVIPFLQLFRPRNNSGLKTSSRMAKSVNFCLVWSGNELQDGRVGELMSVWSENSFQDGRVKRFLICCKIFLRNCHFHVIPFRHPSATYCLPATFGHLPQFPCFLVSVPIAFRGHPLQTTICHALSP